MGRLDHRGSWESWTMVVHGRVGPRWFMGRLDHGGSWESWLGLEAGLERNCTHNAKKFYGASGIANYIVYMSSGGLADHSTNILPECKHLWFYKTALDRLTYSGKQLQHPLHGCSCFLQRHDGGTEREPAHLQDIGHHPGRFGQNCFLFQAVLDPQLPLPL